MEETPREEKREEADQEGSECEDVQEPGAHEAKPSDQFWSCYAPLSTSDFTLPGEFPTAAQLLQPQKTGRGARYHLPWGSHMPLF